MSTFTPHVVTFQDSSAKEGFSAARPDCLSGGRYCYSDPDQDGPLTGRDIVLEDLRLICVYRQTSPDKDYERWFTYVANTVEHCGFIGGKFTAECSEEQMIRSGVDVDAVR